jgi:hypothetical protein
VTKLYRAWVNMRRRCRETKSKDAAYYVGKGVRVCKRWASFENFAADMGPHPENGLTLDRKNGALVYCKSKCRWATRKEQSRNRSNTFNDRRRATIKRAAIIGTRWSHGNIAELAARYGASYGTIYSIVKRPQ